MRSLRLWYKDERELKAESEEAKKEETRKDKKREIISFIAAGIGDLGLDDDDFDFDCDSAFCFELAKSGFLGDLKRNLVDLGRKRLAEGEENGIDDFLRDHDSEIFPLAKMQA